MAAIFSSSGGDEWNTVHPTGVVNQKVEKQNKKPSAEAQIC